MARDKIGDVLGDDFADQYESRIEERREQARKVDKATLMEICYEAIHGGGLKGEEPRFSFQGEEFDHDVFLMEAPDDDIQKFRHPFDSGGVSQSMFHLNDLISCNFNEDMVDLVDRIQEGEPYLVVGRYEERKDEEKDKTYQNVSPVRGILPLEQAKNFADEYDSSMGGTSPEEQAQAQQQEAQQTSADDGSSESEEDDESGTSDGGTDDMRAEEEEADRDHIVRAFKGIGNKDKSILNKTAQGDSDMMDKLVTIVDNNIDGVVERERTLDIFEEEVEDIDGRGEDDEDEDDIDLGDMDFGDDDSEEEGEEEEDASDGTSEDSGSADEDTATSDDAEDDEGDSDDDEGYSDDWF